EIELSSAGAARTLAPDGVLVVELVLTTRPFVGKETMSITNAASLYGFGAAPDYRSADSASATSYGDEAEVSKHVYDRTDDEWTSHLRAEVAADGTLVDDVYVYRIAFIPHGSYGGVQISPVVDELPDAVEFLGFLAAPDVPDPVPALTPRPASLGDGLVVPSDDRAARVTTAQKPGTIYAGGTQSAYFAVRVLDTDAPIVTSIDGTSIRATIEFVDPRGPEVPRLPSTGVGEELPLAGALAALALAVGALAVIGVARARRRRIGLGD